MLVKREFKSRYAGSNLGILWNILHPMVVILTYMVVFSQLMSSRMGDGPNAQFGFLIHLTSGILPWFFFSEVVNRSCGVLVENSGMLKKMAVPELVLYLSVYLTSLMVHGGSLVLLMGLLLVIGVPLDASVLFALPVLMTLGVAGLGIGMILSVLNLLIRDVGQIVSIVLNLMFWSLPIVYAPAILPDAVERLVTLNPFYGFFTLIQLLFGSPAVIFHFYRDSYWLMVIVPYVSILGGLGFLKAHRTEILDAL
jgi:lipopolysaccharide transport system permease protein